MATQGRAVRYGRKARPVYSNVAPPGYLTNLARGKADEKYRDATYNLSKEQLTLSRQDMNMQARDREKAMEDANARGKKANAISAIGALAPIAISASKSNIVDSIIGGGGAGGDTVKSTPALKLSAYGRSADKGMQFKGTEAPVMKYSKTPTTSTATGALGGGGPTFGNVLKNSALPGAVGALAARKLTDDKWKRAGIGAGIGLGVSAIGGGSLWDNVSSAVIGGGGNAVMDFIGDFF